MKTLHRIVLAALFAATLGSLPLQAAAQRDNGSCAGVAGSVSWQRTELFFGRNSPLGEVTEQQFQAFLDGVVTPLFPDGLTVLDANGQFRGGPEQPVEKEKTKVLVLLYPFSKSATANVEQIRAAYKQQFQQQSVLRTDVRSCVQF